MDAVDFFLLRYETLHRTLLLAQTPLLHVYGHYFEARVAAGLWGGRSP